ncbi:MAG: hypothetical protein AXA67_09665 [Methylothermaceae bacteria B42]|nr:MAG: hypothetical protein AXA67_09665 [Methylothermaceae bacteria B42]HHJ39570.1 flagellar hook protein [Methylothermaceae bacterium]
MAITSTGLGSGLDIAGIVQKLVEAERVPVSTQLDRKEADLQAKISSYGTFKSALSEFRSSLAGLRNSSNFEALSATSSNEDVLTASASSNAEVGSFNLEVKQLAQSHGLASGSFADPDDIVGSGTLTIRFGTTELGTITDPDTGEETTTYSFTQNPAKGTLTIDLDDTNNTLTGLRDAINKAGGGVSANIVYDGGGYRLVLSSEDTGKANSMQIEVSDSDGDNADASGLSRLAFNDSAMNMTQTMEAKDAVVSFNGLDITSASNTLDKTLKGVTINLNQAKPGETVNVKVAPNTGNIVESVTKFVEGYNALVGVVKDLTSYNPETQQGSILLGDGTIRNAMSQIRRVMGDVVSGLESAAVRTLVDLGIKTQADGTLEFDSSKLESALKKDPEGVAAVFSETGITSDPRVKFIENSSATKTGSYSVSITQEATRGVLNGGAVSSLTVDDSNDTFRIKVDGTSSGQIQLTQKTYASKEALAAEIQARINGDSTLSSAGAKVSVSYDSDNNRFVIQSQKYGEDSQVEITEVDSNSSAIGLNVAAGTAGQNMAGSIGGFAAEADGQYLKGTQGDAIGMKLFIEDGASGFLGSVTFSRGLMNRLDNVLGGLLDSDGSVTARTEGLQKSLNDINDERFKLNDRMAELEKRFLDKFNAMDSLLGQLQGMGTFLGQQLATLPFNNVSKK